MTIEQLIFSAQQQKDFNAASLFKKILLVAETNKITINDAICYLISIEKKKYNINLLKVAQRFFPARSDKYIKQTNQQDTKCCKLNVQQIKQNTNTDTNKSKETIGCTLEEILNKKPIIKHRTTNF